MTSVEQDLCENTEYVRIHVYVCTCICVYICAVLVWYMCMLLDKSICMCIYVHVCSNYSMYILVLC